MTWFKRIFLFLAVNFLVILTLSIVIQVLGIRPYIDASGIHYGALMGFSLVWGMGGAIISLLISRFMAKMAMGVQVIDPNTQDPELQDLVQMVYSLSRSAGLSTMPEVGIYDSPEINAFATGPTRSHALVAVSTGLLRRMRRDEVEGVVGHEVAHIANGDMVTMTLVQGVVNAFVMFLARAIAFAISQRGRSDDGERSEGFSSGTYFITQFVLEIVFMILGSMVVAYFSRWREFRADAGGARLAGRDKMIAALRALQRNFEEVQADDRPAIQSLKISSKGSGIMRLFSTHPALEDRIARLESAIRL